MPPAPPTKSTRPSMYASSSSSAVKKRSSVSPAEAAAGYHHHHHQHGLHHQQQQQHQQQHFHQQQQHQAVGASSSKLSSGMGVKREISPSKQRFQAQAQAQSQAMRVLAVSQSNSNSSAQLSATIMKPTGVSVSLAAVSGSARENRLLFEDEYSQEVEEYMHEMENQTLASAEFIDMQPELQWYMRPYLVDFLIEIHQQFRLRPEVLYLALNIVDRYVSKRVVYKKHYQLVGCSALWIASKFEDAKDRVPTVKELADMCCSAYDVTAFLQMEGHLLQTIGWTIGHPTAEAWMRLYCQGTQESTQVQHVARFIMETTLFTRDFVGLKPSNIARGCLLMARHICGLGPRVDLCPTEKEVKHVTTCLDISFSENAKHVSNICIEKYAPHYYSKASTVTMQYYAMGRRYRPVELPLTPANAFPSGIVSAWSRRESDFTDGSPSGLYSTSSSECGDETLPKTPCTPVGTVSSVDPFVVQTMSMSMTTIPDGSSSAMSSTMKENIMPAGYDVLGPKKSVPTGANGSGYGSVSQQHQQQRAALQSVQAQGHQMPMLRRLSN